MLQELSPKPESGLEPLTYRLQGDTSVCLKTPLFPAKRRAPGWLGGKEIRLICADFGWLEDDEPRRCP